MKVVGLTGGVATGKSEVARQLRARGIPVLDADLAAREVVGPGQPALEQLVSAFGADILEASGVLDRAALRSRIVADPVAKATVEAITHPAIRTHLAAGLAALAAAGHPIAVVEAALLVETGRWRDYDALLVVTCSAAVQHARLVARDHVDAEAAARLIRAQMPLVDKEALADVLIENNGDREALGAAVDAAWPRVLALLARGRAERPQT